MKKSIIAVVVALAVGLPTVALATSHMGFWAGNHYLGDGHRSSDSHRESHHNRHSNDGCGHSESIYDDWHF